MAEPHNSYIDLSLAAIEGRGVTECKCGGLLEYSVVHPSSKMKADFGCHSIIVSKCQDCGAKRKVRKMAFD